MTKLYVADCKTDTARVLADIRRLLLSARPQLVAEFDGINMAITSGPQLVAWLNDKLGCKINAATQSAMDLPMVVARHLGVVGFHPDWDIGD